LLKTAYSSHKFCFICLRKDRCSPVKSKSIASAYRNYKIVIKPGSRICKAHLDDNGIILTREFERIKTIMRPYSSHSINMFDILSFSTEIIDCSGVFDKFKNMETLEEEYCFKITRWSKKDFITFSKYITSVYDTAGRTKEQLIAIYRYWLTKGIDQTTLAMFGTNTSQQEISHYLAQIRRAINNDFVPYFLGANRSRKFFLKHNNATTIELHQFKKKDLAIFADASYTRLEKSNNNQFQYLCWSQQKFDLLIKPFIICCADGYFIDCYGPFQANQNDASIFDYVLKTDKDLQRILKPHKTVAFLDRGKFFN
jgi:hypothetical protein